MRMISLAIISILLPTILAHSWMSCPPSFITTAGRGGFQNTVCESSGSNAVITEVEAGDRLKVGWTSNNHAGGYVRLSLVKFGDHWGEGAEEHFLGNVMKFVCYGHDRRLGVNNGDCNHPCDARGGCNYQADLYDIERYDTTIGIPTNLPEGLYVLQAALMVGNSQAPYYSCAKLRILKGNPSFNCLSPREPLVYSCVKSEAGPELSTHFLRVGAQRGDFCYRFDGGIGSVDDNLRDVPINVDCDPRITCDNAIHKPICENEFPDMANIRNGIQPGCIFYNTIPRPLPTCHDDISNRDEKGVDCGGAFCSACPTVPSKVIPGSYYSSIVQDNSYWTDGSGGNFKIITTVSKNITETQCWQLILQYPNPVDVSSSWGDAKIVYTNDQHTIFILRRVAWFAHPLESQTIVVNFSASNPKFTIEESAGKVVWKDDNMRLQSATKLEVYDDITKCVS